MTSSGCWCQNFDLGHKHLEFVINTLRHSHLSPISMSPKKMVTNLNFDDSFSIAYKFFSQELNLLQFSFFFWGHVFRKFQRFQTVLKRSSIQFNRLGFDTKNISGRVVPIHSEYQNRFSKITLVHHFRNIFNQKWVGSNKLWFLAVPMLVKDNGENVCCRKTCMLVKRSSTYFTNMD